VYVLNVINQRKIQSFRYFETGSPFEYELIRFLYTKKREIEIQD
jgi:phospholipid-binding lipoprotein MlaA